MRKHFHGAGCDLAGECLVGAEQQLLSGLSARIKRSRNLRAAEGTVCEQAAVFARERHALLDALIDDQITDFGQPIDICFARAEIASFDRVVKQPENTVAVVLIILRGIDPALGRDRVSAARTVLVTEALRIVTELAERRRRRTAGEAAAHHDDLELPPIIRRNETRMIFVIGPLLRERTGRGFRVERPDHNCCAGFTRCRSTATGIEV